MSHDTSHVQIARLVTRFVHYATESGLDAATAEDMLSLLRTPLGSAVLNASDELLDRYPVDDAYKLRMHKMYSTYMTGVTAEFALNVRRIATPLAEVLLHHPVLGSELRHGLQRIEAAEVLDAHTRDVLQRYFGGFTMTEEVVSRAQEVGVAPIRLEEAGGQLRAFAKGAVEAASHAETSVMQLVQWVQILGQAADLQLQHACHPASTSYPLAGAPLRPSSPSSRRSGFPAAEASAAGNALEAAMCGGGMGSESGGEQEGRMGGSGGRQREGEEAGEDEARVLVDRTERLANSLCKLCLTVARLNSLPHSFRMALYAGRRTSDRIYLLLQNLYCARYLRGYAGTSSVYAAVVLDELQARLGQAPGDRPSQGVHRLVGTLAHEAVSITQQLLSSYDEQAGGEEGPVCITAVLAHLLMLAANGGLQGATALADTFTTKSFLAVACAANIPEEFRQDMLQRHSEAVPPGGRCFDLFRIWRLDSGSYEEVARAVLAAWQQRCNESATEGLAPPERPVLMHSNLDSVEDIEQVAHLPDDIRPAVLGFGSLADGFLPFDLPDGCTAEVSMCSVVMKVVQARAERLGQPVQESAAKLGDNAGSGKLQLDPRRPEASKQRLMEYLHSLAGCNQALDRQSVSAALAAAYHDVTRGGILQSAGG